MTLFRLFRLQSTGYGGTIDTTHDPTKVKQMRRVEDTILKIRFNADIGSSMRWNFKPQQYEIKVRSTVKDSGAASFAHPIQCEIEFT